MNLDDCSTLFVRCLIVYSVSSDEDYPWPSEGYGTYRVRDRRKVIRPTLGKGSEHEGAFDLLQNGDRNSL